MSRAAPIICCWMTAAIRSPTLPGPRSLCSPPLRKQRDIDALWQALRDGEIQTISTDHCSFTLAQKNAGREDFTKIPGGMNGVETRGILMYTYGVASGKISLEQMVQILSENPAKLYGVYPRKGVIAPGADADIVVYDPAGEGVITAKDQVCAADDAPYEGFRVQGHIHQVYLRGTLRVNEGKVLDDCGGQYIPRDRCCL